MCRCYIGLGLVKFNRGVFRVLDFYIIVQSWFWQYLCQNKGCISSHDTQLMLSLSHLLPCNLRSHCLYDVLWVELDSFLFPIASTMASWGFAHDCTRASSTFEMRFFDILIEFKVPASGRISIHTYSGEVKRIFVCWFFEVYMVQKYYILICSLTEHEVKKFLVKKKCIYDRRSSISLHDFAHFVI